MRELDRIGEWLSANPQLREAVIVLGTALAAIVSLAIARAFIVRGLIAIARRTSPSWGDALSLRGVFEKLAWIAPAIIVYYATATFAHALEPLILRLANAYAIGVATVSMGAFLTGVMDVYGGSKVAKDVPIKGYIEVTRIILYVSAVVVIISVLLDRSPWVFLSGIGAAMAIVVLVFRDTILSFVASIQIAANDILRIGDWIEMPKYNANGEVIDIALHTVKVQNGDLTITVIPTFKLMEDSFKNWRGIQLAGARRIARAVLVDQTSIGFVDRMALDRFANMKLLEPKLAEIATDSARITNAGIFRAYVRAYLDQHPMVRKDMPLLVRELAPSAEGLPIEIYAHVNETRWASYEALQADIVEHVLAALPEFGLRVFQNPTGFTAPSPSK